MQGDEAYLPDVANSYARYFDIVRADTPALVETAYRLRHQVYCVENPFENAAEHADGREWDDDDERSSHVLLVHRRTGSFAGTVRVILPTDSGSHRPLPIERILAEQGEGRSAHLLDHGAAEISRFAVSKEFRRRCGEDRYVDVATPGASPNSTERRMVPYITFGLIRGVVEICLERGITHICAVMEPALIRIFGRFGIEFEHIGGLVEHHGMRQPCVARLADLLARNQSADTLLWQYTAAFAHGLRDNIAPHAWV